MLFHKYDSISKIYLETIDVEIEPENSVSGILPELTEYYTVAYIDGTWVSVLRPELDIIDSQIVNKTTKPEASSDGKA